ncbi:MAG: hypothetical protein V9F05_14710 [Chitinophagaceae bacterium]
MARSTMMPLSMQMTPGFITSWAAELNNDFWTASMAFTPVQGGASGRTGHLVLSLSEGTLNPYSDTYSICENSNTDAIMLAWTSDFAAAPDNIGFTLYANDNGVVTQSELLSAPYNDTYYIQLIRVAYNYMHLDVFEDEEHEIMYGQIDCFTVPSNHRRIEYCANRQPSRRSLSTQINSYYRRLMCPQSRC